MMDQERAFECMLSADNIFLTGEPGSGKSYLINRFISFCSQKKIRFGVTASTGIAASHIGGSTIHSFVGLGIQKNLSSKQVKSIARKPWIIANTKRLQVLIIDEVSMLDASNIDDIDKVLKEVRRSYQPFGGVKMVFVGDFFQLPPVSQKVQYAFESEAWKTAGITCCYLNEQHRQEDPILSSILRAIRNQSITEEQKLVIEHCSIPETPETKLYTHNCDVNALNRMKLRQLPGDSHSYKMESRGKSALIGQLKRSCPSPEMLEVKQGAVVMFTKNNRDLGYVNGTLGTVVGYHKGLPIVQIAGGRQIIAMAETWSIEDYSTGRKQILASILQIPLKLAWALTIHKSQGMTLTEASINLGETFEDGQGYVALSRVRSLSGLDIVDINEKAFEVSQKVVEFDNLIKSMV